MPTPDDLLAQMPKVELHVHLEGAIPVKTFLHLAERNSVALPTHDEEELRAWYKFRDFPHFVEVYLTLSKTIHTPEDIYEVAYDFLAGQAAQNIIHTDVTFTAVTHYKNHGIPFDEQMDAIARAAAHWRDKAGITLGVIVDIPRDLATPEECDWTATSIAEAFGGPLPLAMGLGGYEVGFPPEQFARHFAIAGEAGVPAIIHAGETEGARSVEQAVLALNAVRIGHGVRAVEDPSVLALLKERDITLEICPTSNLLLGVVEEMAAHPVRQLDAAGIAFTLNSDDPALFDTTMTEELRLATTAFGYDVERLVALMDHGARVSLADEARKAAMAKTIAAFQDSL